MSEAKAPTIDLLGETVRYEVRRSEDATEPRIDVGIEGVTVVVPEDSTVQPESLLSENAAWVIEKKHKFDNFREEVPDRNFEAGVTFPYLDDPHEIHIERRSASVVSKGEFRLAEHHVNQTSVKRALESLYRRVAREHFEERAGHFADAMGLEFSNIEVRNQRTKWGSCSPTGTLGLNWRLMMAPPEIVDYIIVHELAHLREPNHNDNFWELVAEFDSEFESHAEWLNEHSPRLIFSDDDL